MKDLKHIDQILPEKLKNLITIKDSEDKADVVKFYDELWRNNRTIRRLICLYIVNRLNELMKKDEIETTDEAVSKHLLGRRSELRHLFKLISDSGEDPITWLVKQKSKQEI